MTLDDESLPRTYFGHVSSKNLQEVVAMYAADGELILQSGQRISGRGALHEFFQALFLQSPPTPRIVNIVGGSRQYAVELRVTLPGNSEAAVADFFQLDETGLIRSLTVYARALAQG